MMYLAEKFHTPDYWYPADLQKRARVNEYLSWQHTATRMHAAKIIWLKVSQLHSSTSLHKICQCEYSVFFVSHVDKVWNLKIEISILTHYIFSFFK